MSMRQRSIDWALPKSGYNELAALRFKNDYVDKEDVQTRRVVLPTRRADLPLVIRITLLQSSSFLYFMAPIDRQGKQGNSHPSYLLLFKSAFCFSSLVFVLCFA